MQTPRPEWDFDEYSNYIPIIYDIPAGFGNTRDSHDRFVYLKERRNRNIQELHSNVLCFLDQFTLELQNYCTKRIQNNKCIDLFINTDHTFYELYHNVHYKGVNKPLKVHPCRNAHHIGPDGILRAHSRNVMIVIQPDAKNMYNLYCHEIAHTLCNHVRYRPDDHHGDTEVDFPYNEELVQNLSNELNLLNRLRKIYAHT